MRSKSFIAVAGLLVVLLVLAGATFAYDSGRKDTIAKGVSVGGVDLGGLERAAAEQKLTAELSEPLTQPVRVHFHGRRYEVDPQNLSVVVDVRRSVDEALERSQEGGMIGRTVRNLTGGDVEADLDVVVGYDQERLDRRVRRLAERVERPPRDADVDISTAGVEVVESHRGLKVREGELRRTLTQVLTTADAVRDVKIPARFTKPKVTTKEVAKKYPSVIVVNRSSFTLTLYEKLKETKRYTVAIGAAGYDTPVGLYEIQNKAVNPVWNVPNSDWAGSLAGTVVPPGPSNPLKSRWMGIYNGAGIHGTDATYSLGSAASHGCIRMAIPDVEELYDQVDVGTPVYIG